MDLAVPPKASEESAAATLIAAERAELMRSGDADRQLRLAFRMLMAFLEVRYQHMLDTLLPHTGH